jgi:hypothetical protein
MHNGENDFERIQEGEFRLIIQNEFILVHEKREGNNFNLLDVALDCSLCRVTCSQLIKNSLLDYGAKRRPELRMRHNLRAESNRQFFESW